MTQCLRALKLSALRMSRYLPPFMPFATSSLGRRQSFFCRMPIVFVLCMLKPGQDLSLNLLWLELTKKKNADAPFGGV